jgi:hypothetical protein
MFQSQAALSWPHVLKHPPEVANVQLLCLYPMSRCQTTLCLPGHPALSAMSSTSLKKPEQAICSHADATVGHRRAMILRSGGLCAKQAIMTRHISSWCCHTAAVTVSSCGWIRYVYFDLLKRVATDVGGSPGE